jgi:hypothetical protein
MAGPAILVRFIVCVAAGWTVPAEQAGQFLPIANDSAAHIADHVSPRRGTGLAGNVRRGKA